MAHQFRLIDDFRRQHIPLNGRSHNAFLDIPLPTAEILYQKRPAGIAAISALLIEERAHDVPGFRGICADYVARFEKEFGGTDCAELKKKYFREGVRCAELVNANAELLEEFLKGLKG